MKSEEDVEEFLGVPVLGKISTMNKRNLKKKNQRKLGVKFRGEISGYNY